MLKKLLQNRNEKVKEETNNPAVHRDLKYDISDDYNNALTLTEEIENQINLILKEESKMTFGFKSVSEALQYTNEEIKDIENYLVELNDNTEHMITGVFESVENSQNEINISKNTLNNSLDKMNEVSNMFEDFVKLFNQVQKQYEEINGFATIITNIASQTNLLSLNASIEAARAGEVGKGFAVVANEIKNLSRTTETSAKDIIQLLDNMNSIMEILNKRSLEGQDLVKNTTEAINKSNIVFDNISEAENKVNEELIRVKNSQEKNIKNMDNITKNLSKIVERSSKENDKLDELIYSVQKKSDNYLYILNHLNQIKILREGNKKTIK